MPSPFPGMNPYLEQPGRWPDFHDRFLVYLAETLTPKTGPDYVVQIEEHVFVSDDGADGNEREFHTDVSATISRTDAIPAGEGSASVLAAPVRVRLPEDYERDRLSYLSIRDREFHRVVTVLEVLSPANKRPGRDRRQFELKWLTFNNTDVNYVEIDLLRGWPRMPWVGVPGCDYCVAVSRPRDRPEVGLWPLRLRDRLPEIPVPLAEDAPEPTVDLQAILHRVYDAAGYERVIYTGRPTPPLLPEDAAWAADILRATARG